MKKFLCIFSALMLFSSLAFSAPYYDTGSQIFTINAGPVLPTSLTGLGNGDDTISGFERQSVGGYGSICYQVFANPYFALGGELGYLFNFVISDEVFTSVPIQFKVTAFPVQGNFELPISLGVGLNYISYNESSKLTVSAQFDIGARYYFSDEWGVGLHVGLQVIPEFYFGDEKANSNFLATYLPITLSVAYRH